jgi:hypothetical protein
MCDLAHFVTGYSVTLYFHPSKECISASKHLARYVLAIMVLIGFSSYCTLKLLFSRVMVLPQV